MIEFEDIYDGWRMNRVTSYLVDVIQKMLDTDKTWEVIVLQGPDNNRVNLCDLQSRYYQTLFTVAVILEDGSIKPTVRPDGRLPMPTLDAAIKAAENLLKEQLAEQVLNEQPTIQAKTVDEISKDIQDEYNKKMAQSCEDAEVKCHWSGNLSGSLGLMGEPAAAQQQESGESFVPREAIDGLRQKLEEKRASRHNIGKPKLSYIHLDCFEEAARVMEKGALKYGRDNWRLGQDINQLLDSMLRHVAKLQSGEELDQESGLSHIGHIQCNAMFLGLWLKKQQEKGE